MKQNLKPESGLFMMALIMFSIHIPAVYGQNTESVAEVLRKGEIVAGNIQTAIKIHLTDNPQFHPDPQLPEDKRSLPSLLVKKDGTSYFDWTSGQHARFVMEELRQGVHVLQSASKPRGLDIVALTGGREIWPQLRDISCRESPGTRYYDLDGAEQFCPDR